MCPDSRFYEGKDKISSLESIGITHFSDATPLPLNPTKLQLCTERDAMTVLCASATGAIRLNHYVAASTQLADAQSTV